MSLICWFNVYSNGLRLDFSFAALKIEKREKNLLLFDLLALLWSACCLFCATLWSCNRFCILMTWLEVYATRVPAVEPRQGSGQMCWRVSAQMVDSSEQCWRWFSHLKDLLMKLEHQHLKGSLKRGFLFDWFCTLFSAKYFSVLYKPQRL